VLTADIAGALGRHPRHLALCALIAGLVLTDAIAWAIVALGSVLLVDRCNGRLGIALLAGALVLVGAWLGTVRRAAIDRSPVRPLIGDTVDARGFVVKTERSNQYGLRFRVRLTALAERRGWRLLDDLVQFRVRRGPSPLPPSVGEEVRATGKLDVLPQRPAQRDYANYLRRGGVHALLRTDSFTTIGFRGGAVGLLDRIRRRAEIGVGAGLSPGLSALASGMVLGQDERIPQETVQQFQASGLAHLLAVSGQNVTLLAILALPALGAIGLGRRGRLIGVLGLIAFYVPLTGAGPSIMRAGAMGAAGVAAQLAGRPASRWYGLLLACAFTLVIDPRAWLDVGWQLSFSAVVGILCLGPYLRSRLCRLPQAVAEGMTLTVAATAATAPLLAFQFERVSVVSLLANLIALPVVAPIMWLGMLSALAGQVSVGAASLLNALNGFCLAFLAVVAKWSAGLPGAVISFKVRSPLVLAATYLVPSGVVAAIALLQRRSRRLLPVNRAAVILGATLLMMATAAWVAVERRGAHAPGSFTVTFLDVGQGDATLLQTPEHQTVLVDAGPAEADVVSKLHAAGVGSLDVAVLTHPQADHQGGLEAVFRELPVQLLLDDGGQNRLHDRILALARARGTRVVTAHAGMVLRSGGLRIQVLSPPGSEVAGGDSNQHAIVALASYRDLDTLLPADAESDVTSALRLPDVELLKVAHHGSADPGLKGLLERIKPELAVIEAGAGNPFGHPDERTLATLASSVPRVLRTDRDGDVTVVLERRGWRVVTER
jgi:competence protein ComEC